MEEIEFLNSIKNKKRLTAEEEKQLIFFVKENKNLSKEYFYNYYSKIINIIIKRYSKEFKFDENELISEGNLALLTALKNYSEEENTKFSTYASRYIEDSLINKINKESKNIYIPGNFLNVINIVNKEIKNYYSLYNKPPKAEELEKLLEGKINIKLIPIVLSLNKKVISIDNEIKEKNNGEEFLEDDNELYLNEYLSNLMILMQLKKALNKLDKRKRDIISYRYGLKDGKEYRLQEIANIYGVSRERIRQIEIESLYLLKDLLS